MTNHPPFYDDEAVLLSWGESPKDGAWIKLQITEDTVPFLRGLKRGSEHGERFTMVLTGPLQNDETVSPGRGKAAGASTRKDEELPASTGTVQQAAGTPSPAAHSLPPVVGVEPGGESVPSIAAPPGKQRKRWEDLRPSARAAMRVKDPEFWAYITEARGVRCETENAADAWLKKCLNIESKSDLDEFASPFATHFALVDSKFEAWRLARAHGQLER